MIARRPDSLFAQVTLLLACALILSQLVSLTLILSLPSPRPDITPMATIADLLRRGDPQGASGGHYALHRAAAPPQSDALRVDARLTEALAGKLVLPPSRVRLLFARVGEPFSENPIFYGKVVAAWNDGRSWQTLEPESEAAEAVWRQRSLIWFAGSMLLLLPFGWLFAGRLGRPLRGFAAAAERLGHGRGDPQFPIEGPRELRLAGIALNGMHARLEAHVRERTEMVAAIAHDLRTPLARIAFRVEAIDPAVRDSIQGDIEQMRRMIADTLAFARGAAVSARIELVELGGLAATTASKFAELGEDVAMTETPPRAPVFGDPLALERLFTNLIENALRFGDRAVVAVVVDGRDAIASVSDDGPGLPPEQLETVLNPFVRGDPSRSPASGGTGLGLAIARSIAQAHGGTLTLRNAEAGGLVAECRLPLS